VADCPGLYGSVLACVADCSGLCGSVLACSLLLSLAVAAAYQMVMEEVRMDSMMAV